MSRRPNRCRACTHGLPKAQHPTPEPQQQDAPGPRRPLTDPDTVPVRTEAFDRENGGGVTVCKNRGDYTLTPTATEVPIERLKPEGSRDTMRVLCWSWQNRWKDVGDIGGLMLPLDEALDAIANTEVFWIWTCKKCKVEFRRRDLSEKIPVPWQGRPVRVPALRIRIDPCPEVIVDGRRLSPAALHSGNAGPRISSRRAFDSENPVIPPFPHLRSLRARGRRAGR